MDKMHSIIVGSARFLVLFLLLLLLLIHFKAAHAYASQCLVQDGCLQPGKCCNDKAKGWPESYQFCTPDQWGLQCSVCQDSCWAFEAYLSNGTSISYNVMKYTLPSLDLFAASCDVKTTTTTTYDEKKLGIYCCKPCFIYRIVNEKCGYYQTKADGADDTCYIENAAQSEPFLRMQATLENTEETPHWILVPPTPMRGIEDARVDFTLFQNAYRIALAPASSLEPAEGHAFNETTFPHRMGLTNIAIGVNQASQRSQHQIHFHAAGLPIPFRKHILQQKFPHIRSGEDKCITSTPFIYGPSNVTYYGWYFDYDLSNPPVHVKPWDLRSLALKQCPQLVNMLVRDDKGQTIKVPPGPPLSGINGPNPTADDFQMSQIAVMIVPGFSIDPFTNRPAGYYLLMGTMFDNFIAEVMLCTNWGLDNGVWSLQNDCPPTAKGWPAPELYLPTTVGEEETEVVAQPQHHHYRQHGKLRSR